MTNALAKLRVILTAAVTWLVAVATVLTIFSEEIANAFGDDAAPIVTWIARILVWLGAATAIIRRVTPVIPAARGITTDGSTPLTDRERLLIIAHESNGSYTNPPPP